MNMAVNKVIYGGKTIIDLTADTVTPESLLKGVTAHDRTGAEILGTYEKSSDAEDLNDVLTEQEALIEELKETIRSKTSGGG